MNELCALVQRSELRDLVDVEELLKRGGNLAGALKDAAKKDSGFSPLTLAWLLKELPIESVAQAEGWTREESAALAEFRISLLERIRDLSRPDER